MRKKGRVSMWQGKQVVILGFARQGMALAQYLVARGARVTISDAKPAEALAEECQALSELPLSYALGGHPPALLESCDMLCLSGGVPIDLPIVLEARRRGIPLSNDAQVFFEACPAPIVGITGSAGKTTTTTLVGEMLKAEGGRVWVGGNIGNPPIADVERMKPTDVVVMELSSFQLDLMTRSPRVACITNLTPNHLDRHGTMDAYIAAKRRILDFQTADDWQVLNADDPITTRMNTRANTAWFSLDVEPQGDGAWLDEYGDLRVRIAARGMDDRICHRRDLLLMGKHNIANVLAAGAASAIAGASVEAMRAVATTFAGVPHRLQLVHTAEGVRYYDDSIATAPERLMAALHCFDAPVILLCGGRDKHLPWDKAVDLMAGLCKHVVLFGEMAPMLAGEIERRKPAAGSAGLPFTVCDTLEAAVAAAKVVARAGDVVLLSPGGTSYDAFKDFAERGDRFAEWVRGMGGAPGQTGAADRPEERFAWQQ